MLLPDADKCNKTDRMVDRVGDMSLAAEVQRFHAISVEADHMAAILQDNKKMWGELAAAKLGCIHWLKMADALAQIKDQDDGLLNDALRAMREFPERQKCRGHHF